jgi:hypothetical protein
MRAYACQPLPGDVSDPQGLIALLDRYLLWPPISCWLLVRG